MTERKPFDKELYDADDSAKEQLITYLAKKGFDPAMGARPMARLIQDTIRSALADELLFSKLANGGKVTVDLDTGDRVKLIFAAEEKNPEATSVV